jgi:hypothetical protein
MNARMLKLSFLILNLSLILSTYGQDNRPSDIVFLGADFTNARFIGIFNDKEKIVDKFLNAWNDFLISEYKEKIADILNVENLRYDLSVEYDQKKQIRQDDLFSYKENPFTGNVIEERIKNFSSQFKEGIGLVIFIDKFDNNEDFASGWVTLINLSTLEVIKKGYYSGGAEGIGITNHWAEAIINLLKNCKKDKFFNSLK